MLVSLQFKSQVYRHSTRYCPRQKTGFHLNLLQNLRTWIPKTAVYLLLCFWFCFVVFFFPFGGCGHIAVCTCSLLKIQHENIMPCSASRAPLCPIMFLLYLTWCASSSRTISAFCHHHAHKSMSLNVSAGAQALCSTKAVDVGAHVPKAAVSGCLPPTRQCAPWALVVHVCLPTAQQRRGRKEL